MLDISLDVNRAAPGALLARGVDVAWFDHHGPGKAPRHPRLSATIDTAPDAGASMLVDRHLGGRHRAWETVAACGDNPGRSAERLAAGVALAQTQAALLRSLWQGLAYAECGESAADPVLPPVDPYPLLYRYDDPSCFIAAEPAVRTLSGAARSR